MKEQIIKFWRDEEGATAIEYGLIAGLIAVGLIFSLEGVRTAISGLFDKIANLLNGVSPSSGAPKSI
jgi:pilus assembly protein Flp/PilA